MPDWSRVRAAKQAEAESLRQVRLSEVVPSRRDFVGFIGRGRGDVAVIATLRRRDPWSGAAWNDLNIAAAATALDDADVAALAVTTEPTLHAGQLDDLDTAAAAATAAMLRDEPLLHPLDVYHSRMHGADACVIAVAWVDDATLQEMVRVTHSLHMAAVLAVGSLEDVGRAVVHERDLVGLLAAGDDGRVDVALAAKLAAAIPARQAVLLLGDVVDAAQWPELRGTADAALVARAMFDADDPVGALAAYG